LEHVDLFNNLQWLRLFDHFGHCFVSPFAITVIGYTLNTLLLFEGNFVILTENVFLAIMRVRSQKTQFNVE